LKLYISNLFSTISTLLYVLQNGFVEIGVW